MKDYYRILEINKDATSKDIKAKFKSLARKYHPDLNPNNKEAEESFKEINEAYSVLSNEEERKKYDNKLNGAFNSNKESKKEAKKQSTKRSDINFENIDKSFEDFFGFNPKAKEKKLNTKKNKIDTTSIFEGYFGNFKK